MTISDTGWISLNATTYFDGLSKEETNRGIAILLDYNGTASDTHAYFRSADYGTDPSLRPYAAVQFTDAPAAIGRERIKLKIGNETFTISPAGGETITIVN